MFWRDNISCRQFQPYNTRGTDMIVDRPPISATTPASVPNHHSEKGLGLHSPSFQRGLVLQEGHFKDQQKTLPPRRFCATMAVQKLGINMWSLIGKRERSLMLYPVCQKWMFSQFWFVIFVGGLSHKCIPVVQGKRRPWTSQIYYTVHRKLNPGSLVLQASSTQLQEELMQHYQIHACK